VNTITTNQNARGSNKQSELRFVPPNNDFKDEKQKIKRVPERHNGSESRCK